MDKTRIVKFLDSLEESGLMAANQQSIVLRPEMDGVTGAGSNKGCANALAKSCGGSGNTNYRCTNSGDACEGSVNQDCINAPAGTIGTNYSTTMCKR